MCYHRVDKVVDLLKEIDRSVLESNDVKNIPGAIDTSNHFLLRHIAINTAIIADYIDRIIERGDDD